MSNSDAARQDAGLSPDDIADALDRVVASPGFLRSKRLSDFLRYIVQGTLDNRAHLLKGYTIGVEALGRPTRFNPEADSIVRVTATRVRLALARYYADEGRDDPVMIELLPGSYVPSMRLVLKAQAPTARTRARGLWRRLLAATGVGLLPPPSTQLQHFDGREIRQVQQAQGTPAARPR